MLDATGRIVYSGSALSGLHAPAIRSVLDRLFAALSSIPGPIGLVLLDGWKDMCLPVLRLLEPRLASGALVVADDIDQTAMTDYLEYVRDPLNGYVSVAFPLDDGMEISGWTGFDAASE